MPTVAIAVAWFLYAPSEPAHRDDALRSIGNLFGPDSNVCTALSAQTYGNTWVPTPTGPKRLQDVDNAPCTPPSPGN